MSRKYFSCRSGHEDSGRRWHGNFDICKKHNIFLLHHDTKLKGCIEQIRKGDILFLLHGEHFKAFAKATTKIERGTLKDIDGIDEKDIIDDNSNNIHLCHVGKWMWRNEKDRYGIKDNTIGGSDRDTVKQIEREFAFKIIEGII